MQDALRNNIKGECWVCLGKLKYKLNEIVKFCSTQSHFVGGSTELSEIFGLNIGTVPSKKVVFQTRRSFVSMKSLSS
jgi:hypothetical protein